MVRDPGLEPGTPDVSDRYSKPTELIPHGGTDGLCLPCPKIAIY